MAEGERRTDKVAFGCAGNCYKGSEKWWWDKDQNLAEGAVWCCDTTYLLWWPVTLQTNSKFTQITRGNIEAAVTLNAMQRARQCDSLQRLAFFER